MPVASTGRGRRRRGRARRPRRRAAAGPSSPGRMSAPARLAIMIPPVSVCHQLSWTGRPNASAPQTTASGLSGSPTLATNRSARQVVPRGRARRRPASACASPSAPCTRRVTRSSLEDPVPALGVELGLVDDAGHAVRERGDDAVGRAGDPAGVGGAPEDVVGVQVERDAAGGVVGDDRLVDVDARPSGVPVVPLVKCSRAGSSGVGRRGSSNVRSDARPAARSRSTVPGDGVGRRRAARGAGRAAGRGSARPCAGTAPAW